MCIISVEPKGLRNNKQTLERMNSCNDDGVGFAFSTGKKIVIKKYRDFDKFYKNYSQCKNLYGKQSAFMVHFRIKTHGTNKGVYNVHPFRVNKNLVFSHNGTIQNVGESHKKSDTRLFNENILRRLSDNFLQDKTQRKLIETFIGYSKLAFITLGGRYEILNEQKGLWSGGMWYSNESFKPTPKFTGYSYGAGWGTVQDYSYTPYNERKAVTKPKAVNKTNKKKDKPKQLCAWCKETPSNRAVGVKWSKDSEIDWERLCGDCENTARIGSYSIHY